MGRLGLDSSILSKTAAATRTAAASSGDVSYTGAGFAPTAVLIFAVGTDAADNFSLGIGDSAAGEAAVKIRDLGGTPPTVGTEIDKILRGDDGGGNTQIGALKTMDSDGITITWTKGTSGEAVSFIILYLR